MRGSTPLDVAAASCIDNNELALALQEQDLEMVCQPKEQMGKLYDQFLWPLEYSFVSVFSGGEIFGRLWPAELPYALIKRLPRYWVNPCGGEKYLDFLRFAVFVNGLYL